MTQPPPSEPERSELDTHAQQRLVLEHSYVAKTVDRRYRRTWMEKGEIENEVYAAMLQAAPGYRRDKGPFGGYVWLFAVGAAMKAVDGEGRFAKVKRAVLDDVMGARRHGSVMTDTPNSVQSELHTHVRDAALAYVLNAASRAAAEGPEEAALHAERKRLVREAVAGLGDELRDLATLYYLEEVDLETAAGRLDMSYATARRRLKAARELLHPRLVAAGVTPEPD